MIYTLTKPICVPRSISASTLVTLGDWAPKRLGVKDRKLPCLWCSEKFVKVWWSPSRPTPSVLRLIRWGWLKGIMRWATWWRSGALALAPLQWRLALPKECKLRDKICVLNSLAVNPSLYLYLLCMLVGLLIRLFPSILCLELACHIGCSHLVAYPENLLYPHWPKNWKLSLKFVVSYSPPSSRPLDPFNWYQNFGSLLGLYHLKRTWSVMGMGLWT